MLEEASLELILTKIDETRNYRLDEIKNKDFFVKIMKKHVSI